MCASAKAISLPLEMAQTIPAPGAAEVPSDKQVTVKLFTELDAVFKIPDAPIVRSSLMQDLKRTIALDITP